MSGDLVSALADLREKEALEITRDRLTAGDDALSILDDAKRTMETVGKRFGNHEYFLPELVYSGEILKESKEQVRE